MSCYLDYCTDGHDNCVVYSHEADGVVSWSTHLADNNNVLAQLNNSYSTHDRRSDKVLTPDDYPAALAAEVDADPETTTAPWWKPWAR